jgi:pre-rRNA-processing protein TSR3
MERSCPPLPVRSLGPWRTAYPRKSKLFDDPTAGLATIEALYAAYVQLGRDPRGLLDDYFWASEFCELNRELLSVGANPTATGPRHTENLHETPNPGAAAN